MCVVLLVLVWAAAASGQEKRVVAVNVVDEQGQPVTGLRAENFRGKFRGEAVKIVSAEWDARPKRIVILLDMSESMDGTPGKWSYAQTAFRGLLAHGPEGARLALVTFDGAPEKRIGFEEWEAQAGLALGELEKPGRVEKGKRPRSLWEAWGLAEQMLAEPRPGDVVYFITDGSPVSSDALPADSGNSRSLECDGVRFFTFDFYERGSGGWDLSSLASSSGGEALHTVLGNMIRDRRSKAYVPLEGVPPSLLRFYRQMGEMYQVEVELPREVDKTRGWELEVVDAAGKKMKGTRVVYPRKLARCGEKP